MMRSMQLRLLSKGDLAAGNWLACFAYAIMPIAWILATLLPARFLWPLIRLIYPVRTVYMLIYFSESGLSGLSVVDAVLLTLCTGIACILNEPCRLRLADVLCTAKLTAPLKLISPEELEAALKLHTPQGGQFPQIALPPPATWLEEWTQQLLDNGIHKKLNDALSWTTSSFTSYRGATPHTAESANALLDWLQLPDWQGTAMLHVAATPQQGGDAANAAAPLVAGSEVVGLAHALEVGSDDADPEAEEAEASAWAAVDAADPHVHSDEGLDSASSASDAGSGASLAVHFPDDNEPPPLMVYTDASYAAEWRADAERRDALRNRRRHRSPAPLVDRATIL
jgi:hypothetical protein